MIPFRFPLRWGTQDSAASVVVTPLWTKLTPDAITWQVRAAQIQPRFARLMVNQDTGPQFVRVTSVVS